MAFILDNFGADTSNAKASLGGIKYFRYFNKNNDTITNAGYFPADLGLEIGDRICVIPSSVTDADVWYVVESITNRKVKVVELSADMDLSKVVNADVLPTASADNEGMVYLYTGETDESKTHGYVYECQGTPVYDSTVEFNPASLSGTTAACSGSDFAALVAEWGTGAIDTIIKGTLTYDESGELLVFVGQDDTNTTVCTFQLYKLDFEDAGFTFTGTFQDGDVIAFTCTIEETGATYAWARIDVQPQPAKELPTQAGNSGKFLTTNGVSASWATVGGLPSQSGQSGKFLTTDGTDASWSDKPLVNNVAAVYQSTSLSIGNSSNANNITAVGKTSACAINGVTVGYSSKVITGNSVAVGSEAQATGGATTKYGSVAIGRQAKSAYGSVAIGSEAQSVSGSVQIGHGTNSTPGTVSFSTSADDGANWNTYQLLDANGKIPADRLGTGYDATKTQTLKNVQGVLTWVDD